MYIVVSWDISAEGEKWSDINNQIQTCLEPFQNIRPLNTFYFIELQSEQQRQQIANCILSVKNSVDVAVMFAISPLFEDRRWIGTTPGLNG